MRSITSGVFFQRLAATTRAAHPFHFDVLLQQLAPAPRHRAGVEAEQLGDASVTAVAGLQRFEPGVQAALLLVQQAEEQHDRGPQLVRHDGGLGQRPGHAGLGQKRSPPQQLSTPAAGVRRAVQEAAGDGLARQAGVAYELAKSVLGADVEQVVELFNEKANLSALDLGGSRRQQRAVDREPNLVVSPQSVLVELSDLVERVEAAAMRVARSTAQLRQLAEHRSPGGRA